MSSFSELSDERIGSKDFRGSDKFKKFGIDEGKNMGLKLNRI